MLTSYVTSFRFLITIVKFLVLQENDSFVPIYINGAFLGLNQYLPGCFCKLHFFKQVFTMMSVVDFSGKNLFSLNVKWIF